MKDCCKKTIRNSDEKKQLTNRLHRISGQLTGVEKMIEEDAYCNDVLIQLSAIEKSVKSLSNIILENDLYRCVSRDLEKGNFETFDEVMSLFKRFHD